MILQGGIFPLPHRIRNGLAQPPLLPQNQHRHHHRNHNHNHNHAAAQPQRYHFDDTIALLLRELTPARKDLECAVLDFEREIRGVKAYASREVLDRLWELKVGSGKGGSKLRIALSPLSRALDILTHRTSSSISSRHRHARLARDPVAVDQGLLRLKNAGARCEAILMKLGTKACYGRELDDELMRLRRLVEGWVVS